MRETANDDDGSLWRKLDWNDVRMFLAVAETGSLNAAARNLGITQPTISRRMEDLEYRLGTRLFSRSSRGVALTDAGALVRDMAANMAKFGDAIVREMSGGENSEAGRVRLAAPDGLAAVVLAPRVAEFQRANPEIEIVLDCGLWPDAPLDGETHLTLEFNETCSPELVSIPIATVHYAYFASQDYLNLYGEPKSPSELAQHRIVRHVSHREQVGTWNPKIQAVFALAGAHLVTNSSLAMLAAIKHGAGIGGLPTFIAHYESDLIMLDLETKAHPLLFLRYSPSAIRKHRVQRVKDWLGDIFDAAHQPWYRADYIHPKDFDRLAGEKNIPAVRARSPG